VETKRRRRTEVREESLRSRMGSTRFWMACTMMPGMKRALAEIA
jgi:hypothetical protein